MSLESTKNQNIYKLQGIFSINGLCDPFCITPLRVHNAIAQIAKGQQVLTLFNNIPLNKM